MDKYTQRALIITTPLRAPNIDYQRGAAEATGLPAGMLDVVSIQYVLHECPPDAITAILREAARLLKPGGVAVVVDTDPKSAVLQSLPPAIATLQKSTEPYSDVYYSFDLQAAMADASLVDVHSAPCSSRHRCVLARRLDL